MLYVNRKYCNQEIKLPWQLFISQSRSFWLKSFRSQLQMVKGLSHLTLFVLILCRCEINEARWYHLFQTIFGIKWNSKSIYLFVLYIYKYHWEFFCICHIQFQTFHLILSCVLQWEVELSFCWWKLSN